MDISCYRFGRFGGFVFRDWVLRDVTPGEPNVKGRLHINKDLDGIVE